MPYQCVYSVHPLKGVYLSFPYFVLLNVTYKSSLMRRFSTPLVSRKTYLTNNTSQRYYSEENGSKTLMIWESGLQDKWVLRTLWYVTAKRKIGKEKNNIDKASELQNIIHKA